MADSSSGRQVRSPTGTRSESLVSVSYSIDCRLVSLWITEQLGSSATKAATSSFSVNMSASPCLRRTNPPTGADSSR